jgi:hypothetical protein
MALLLVLGRGDGGDQSQGNNEKNLAHFCYAFVPGNRNRDVSITFSGEVDTGSQQEKTAETAIRTVKSG